MARESLFHFHQKLSAVCALEWGRSLSCAVRWVYCLEKCGVTRRRLLFCLRTPCHGWSYYCGRDLVGLRVPGVALRSGLLGLRATSLQILGRDVVYTRLLFILFAVLFGAGRGAEICPRLANPKSKRSRVAQQEHPSVGLGTIDFFRKHVQPRSRIPDDPSKPNFDKISIFVRFIRYHYLSFSMSRKSRCKRGPRSTLQ